MKKRCIIFLFIFVLLISAIESLAIERRRPQFLTEPSYLIFPLLYSLAGIGQGIVVTGLAGNIGGTNIDAYGLGIFGDAGGTILAVEDIHILPELLILEFQRQDIDRAVVNNYEKRGMDSKKEDFTLIEVNKADSNYGKLTLSLFDRRLEVFSAFEKSEAWIIKIRDSEGEILTDLKEPFISKEELRRFGFLVDYTDDRVDPKKGVRFGATYKSSPAQANEDPDFYIIDKSLTYYIPIAKPVTWAFNFFLSDAYVTRKGETNPAAIRQELGFDCSSSDSECLEAEQEIVNMFIAQRKNGTSTDLGGDERLRSYPDGRYRGAHTFYYATELRWNISEEVRPFDFWIWKDVATGLQLAFFYETGSVSEKKGKLGDVTRSSYGSGFRLVSASGFVYRADYATGKEGGELSVIFSYPW